MSIARVFLIAFILGSISMLSLSGCSLFGSGPSLEWSETQMRPIIQLTDCCGFVPQIVPLNYIPDAQIWGDGRYIWVSEGPDGSRVVTETSLSSEQIENLLDRFLDAGYFQWRDEYADYSITDIPWQCINVELIANSKSVCEYYRGAPQAFHEIYNDLALGLNMSGSHYVPEQGYLTSYSMEGIGLSGTELQSWNASELGLDLLNAQDGVWIEGVVLQRAWEIINDNLFSNMVESNGRVYQLALQIPGISMIEPETER